MRKLCAGSWIVSAAITAPCGRREDKSGARSKRVLSNFRNPSLVVAAPWEASFLAPSGEGAVPTSLMVSAIHVAALGDWSAGSPSPEAALAARFLESPIHRAAFRGAVVALPESVPSLAILPACAAGRFSVRRDQHAAPGRCRGPARSGAPVSAARRPSRSASDSDLG